MSTMMSSKDFENLAQMLDKNAGFSRPKGQTTGFSLQEDEAAGREDATLADGTAPPSGKKTPAAAVPLPSTVVDQQLHLPCPTHSKEAQQQRAKAEQMSRPQGNEIWTQQELEAVYQASLKAGGASVMVAAARAGGGTGAPSAKPRPMPGAEEPPHTVLYQQKLRAEDVYLGVDFTRDESSAASDGVVVKVEMAKTASASGLTLHVEPFLLTLSSAEYFLSAPLPRKVVAGVADAKWDSAARILTVQLTGDSSDDEVKVL